MGKPSSTSLYRSSECAIQSFASKQKTKGAMSAHKIEQLKKKNHNHVRKNINKLFNRLQRDSMGSRNSSNDHTQDLLDTTPRNLTIVVKNDSFTPQRKRKSSNALTGVPDKTRRKSNSLIEINDDTISLDNDSCIIISPTKDNSNKNINCSTPIAKRNSENLQNLIINNFPKTSNSLCCTQTKENDSNEGNRTRLINKDSYLTIDLTADSENKTNPNITVIDVDNTPNYSNESQEDCTLVSISNGSLSMSGDSDVTVIRNDKKSKMKQLKKFTNNIEQLNTTEKANLLKFIAQKIFNGCDLKSSSKTAFKTTAATDTDEDTYIKEVILGESKTPGATVSHSRNSIGSNIYHPSKDVKNTTGLRMVVIDGSNVAMEHTKGRVFSVEGLKICIDYFLRRGHVVKAFVPRFRCKFGKSSNPRLLDFLEREGLVVYTPSREIQGKSCTPYDDRYILQCAAEFDGVVISGDNYRDLINENKRWRFIIENRILPFTWVNNMIMFPKDPFGRGGPTLDMLLKHPTPANRTDDTVLCLS